mgnify:CR=1 FL=1
MAWIDKGNEVRESDLVFHEIDPCVGYAREDIVIPEGDVVKAGTVYFRALSELDPFAEYAKLEDAADLTVDNEFVVVFGNGYGMQTEFTAVAGGDGKFNAVCYKRGLIQLKEGLIRENLPEAIGGDEAEFGKLKELLKRQGVIIERQA